MGRAVRILAAKPGLDGHDRGIKVVCNALRDAGMEVIYTGLRQTPEQIASSAIQEDVDIIAVSILSGAHNTLLPRIIDILKGKQAEHMLLIAGGIIPEEDIPLLCAKGFCAIFGPGTTSKEIITFINKRIQERDDRGFRNE